MHLNEKHMINYFLSKVWLVWSVIDSFNFFERPWFQRQGSWRPTVSTRGREARHCRFNALLIFFCPFVFLRCPTNSYFLHNWLLFYCFLHNYLNSWLVDVASVRLRKILSQELMNGFTLLMGLKQSCGIKKGKRV